MQKVIEYRVRPVTRYIITRYHSFSDGSGNGEAGSEVLGLFESAYNANKVCAALGHAEDGATRFLVDEPETPVVPAAPRE